MKKCFLGILVLSVVFFSCSKDEIRNQNQETNRPSVPIQAGEVQIGNQIWMTKNLNVSRYRNGDPIPEVQDPTQWANLTTGAWCYYNNDSANGSVYGKLYNWYAVNDPRGLAPQGYHVPNNTEWNNLVGFLGSDMNAGGKMKSITIWTSPNTGANNTSGFSGLPGGYRDNFGSFYSVLSNGCWWSSCQSTTTVAWYRVLGYSTNRCDSSPHAKTVAFSVRCLKD